MPQTLDEQLSEELKAPAQADAQAARAADDETQRRATQVDGINAAAPGIIPEALMLATQREAARSSEAMGDIRAALPAATRIEPAMKVACIAAAAGESVRAVKLAEQWCEAAQAAEDPVNAVEAAWLAAALAHLAQNLAVPASQQAAHELSPAGKEDMEAGDSAYTDLDVTRLTAAQGQAELIPDRAKAVLQALEQVIGHVPAAAEVVMVEAMQALGAVAVDAWPAEVMEELPATLQAAAAAALQVAAKRKTTEAAAKKMAKISESICKQAANDLASSAKQEAERANAAAHEAEQAEARIAPRKSEACTTAARAAKAAAGEADKAAAAAKKAARRSDWEGTLKATDEATGHATVAGQQSATALAAAEEAMRACAQSLEQAEQAEQQVGWDRAPLAPEPAAMLVDQWPPMGTAPVPKLVSAEAPAASWTLFVMLLWPCACASACCCLSACAAGRGGPLRCSCRPRGGASHHPVGQQRRWPRTRGGFGQAPVFIVSCNFDF